MCNMSLGLCALFKVKNVLHCKVKFVIKKKIEKKRKIHKTPQYPFSNNYIQFFRLYFNAFK